MLRTGVVSYYYGYDICCQGTAIAVYIGFIDDSKLLFILSSIVEITRYGKVQEILEM